ncbi:prephenate dehydratase [Polymorphobacter fuscus]|uniref:prephenate dehydratase n=1 Tax=Sandarakinorhabdus fusca TaxID=1439888 RepID=A0A7C9KXR2_9SPHN|nr:prephenate dehydratase [Polymorphobacter fuscus]KAB7648500.1 prephenate dehydratase [Polymorphobacter fuscus]MQT16028.1 prephenate dehydratase [Polymorphobacter fuscus]NJC07695.1 prephenate dehydratase [Polymorphobacter fuscus]
MSSYPLRAEALVTAMTARADAAPAAAVAFQGAPGAYSHQAVRELFPEAAPLPCVSFEDAIEAVQAGRCDRAVIPIENSLHGRVADIHFLLPESGLFIIAEHFVRIRHCLMGVGRQDMLRQVISHPQALGQVRGRIRKLGIEPVQYFDTAAAAAHVAGTGDASVGAVASKLAAELYGLTVFAEGIEDADHNTTRFVVLAREAAPLPDAGVLAMTSMNFEVRNVPAALFKSLGGFATNGINITKLESYIRDGSFAAAEFYAEIVGSTDDPAVVLAMEELRFHTKWVKVIGTYPCVRERTA